MCKVMDLAAKIGCPVIGINDSGGARIQEGVVSLGAYGDVFVRNVQCSGVIPQISLIMGPCAGGAVYSPAMTDFILMVKETSHMFITGPDVIRTVTGEEVEFEELGGAMSHNTQVRASRTSRPTTRTSASRTRATCSRSCPRTTSSRRRGCSPPTTRQRMDEELDAHRPRQPEQALRHARRRAPDVVDDGEFLEVQEHFATEHHLRLRAAQRLRRSASSATSRARWPACSTSTRRCKAARFVRTCDAYNIPLLTLVDVPGFLPGTTQEWGGIIRHGAKLLYAYTEATVPKITLITRKAYGGAYDVMASKHMLADFNFAWPSAEIAVMGPEGAVNIIHRRDIASSPTPDERRGKLIDDYKARFANPYSAAERGYIDDVIVPHETRPKLIAALETLRTKRVARPEAQAREHPAVAVAGARRRRGPRTSISPTQRYVKWTLDTRRGRERPFHPRRFQAVIAMSSLSFSAGVAQPRVWRGRPLSSAATRSSWSWLWTARSVPLGKYWRSSPLVFSLEPRCQGLCGSQK